QFDIADLTQPSGVTLNGRALPHRAAGSDAQGWSYDRTTATVTVNTSRLPTAHVQSVAVTGARLVDRSEPPQTP
ncbi:MAG TPA: hypothetical protein VNG12_09915, partial [Acidimicrobiales bacterium]|nr:hypothetical protein [Acidimicrobiales bacterium]